MDFFVFLHMIARTAIISFLLLSYVAISQEVSLPADLRQHALTQYNASLFNPAFSLDRNNPESISFWTRWQWQQVDTDPTTLFLNYSRRIDEKSGFGAGFFQHNTGIYFNTGGVVNYAYEFKLNPIIKLSVGANLFGFQQQLADDRFVPPDVLPIPIDLSDDFIFQLAPGFNLSVENFSLSMASENLFDYNVTDNGANTDKADKIFMGMASYDFPVMASDSTAFLRPSIYLRTIPEQDNQIGFNTLFSTQKYWGQAGYNNFYGISIGGGGTILNKFSLGALVEFGTSSSLNSKDSSFEIIASYFLGNPQNRRPKVVNVFDTLNDDVVLSEEEEEFSDEISITEAAIIAEAAAAQKERDEEAIEAAEAQRIALNEEAKEEEAAEELKRGEAEREKIQKQKDSLEQVKKIEAIAADNSIKEERRVDSINTAKAAEALAASEKIKIQKQDSIRKAKEELEGQPEIIAEKVTPQAGEKYEEVLKEGDLEPGFYLIANVFGTKKYFDAFMQDLRKKGIEPGSFLRARNNYNYAYLKRYATISEARSARDNNFGGKYEGKTWIFRVVGE